MTETETSLQLSPHHAAIVRTLLHQYVPSAEVWVYGSRAKGTARPSSDLDLVVFAATNKPADIDALREAFEDSDLPFRVDLFVWDEIPESFKPNILNEHIPIQHGVGQHPELAAGT